jgi:DNA-directed RNA polymerase subunit F
MIKNTNSLSMAEALEYIKKLDSESEVAGFIKKFTQITPKEAKEIRKKINELGLLKVREEQISKIIDVLPDDAQDLNKIFIDISLDEDETNKILDTIKQYK